MPFIIYRYIAKYYSIYLVILLASFIGLILLFDIIELGRLTYNVPTMTLQKVVEMCALKNYNRIQKIWPFLILIATIFTYRKLNYSNELIAMKATGLSTFQILIPPVTVVLLLSSVHVFFFNSISAHLLARYQHLEAVLLKGHNSLIKVAQSGLWFKHEFEGEELIIHALRISQKTQEIYDLNLLFFDKQGKFVKRIDACKAAIREDLIISNATIVDAEYNLSSFSLVTLPIHLKFAQITDSLALPETIPLWRLLNFITITQESGFSTTKYQLYFFQILFTPLLWISMMWLGYAFSSAMPRFQKTGVMAIISIGICFIVYFITDFLTALALSGSIPILAAALSPLLIACILSYYFMLHYEFT